MGDDLYANQPLCELIKDEYKQFFIFVCKPTSHTTLYKWIDGMEKGGRLDQKQKRKWNGQYGEIWTYRFATNVPIKSEGMLVNWCALEITHEDTGKRIYKNSWVTNHAVDINCVAEISNTARTRWYIENGYYNTITTKGYHAKHNFGHKGNLSNVFLTLNILAFFIHTIQDITDRLYRELRKELGRRDTFYHDIQSLTRYWTFKQQFRI